MNCSHNIYEVDDGFKGTAAEVAKHLGVSNAMVYATEQREGKTKGHRIKLENCGRNKATEYEVYDGEEKIFVGTSEKIAKKFAVTSYTARVSSTWYKKGNKPWLTKEVGTRVLRTKNNKKQYAYVKLGDCNWKLEHILVWEKAHGKLPEGTRLIHIDGDNYNNNLDNLMPITSQELLNVNQEGLTDNAELNKAIIYRAKINRKLGRKG